MTENFQFSRPSSFRKDLSRPFQPYLKSQNQTIVALKRQNDFLKSQLANLIKQQSLKQITPAVTSRNNWQQNSEYQAQRTYQEKLHKIKRSKSRRNSKNATATAPDSPVFHKEIPIKKQFFHNTRQVPVLAIQQNLKFKFISPNQLKNTQQTLRRGTKSPEIKQFVVSPRFTVNGFPLRSASKGIKGHQRAESSFETRPSLNQNNQKTTNFNSYQSHCPKHHPMFKKTPIDPSKELLALSRQQIGQKLSSPRGNIYVEQDKFSAFKQIKQISDKNVDSQVSIEGHIKPVNAPRKLNYNIYLSQQGNQS